MGEAPCIRIGDLKWTRLAEFNSQDHGIIGVSEFPVALFLSFLEVN